MPTTETTEAVLDAAEQLFAEHGYEGTSIREITRRADVNVAAVHYHFGDKQAVLRAVTDRIVTPLNERRIRMLDLAEAAAAPAPPSIEAVTEAFIRPDIETMQWLQQRGPTAARVVGQIYQNQTPWIQDMAVQQFATVGERFQTAMAQACPDVPEDELYWRLTQVVTLLVGTFAAWPPSGRTEAEAEELIARLVGFASAGLARGPTERN